ncbi:MAG TPA: hypothetical protein VFZ52_13345 [Chryseolinea sp.]
MKALFNLILVSLITISAFAQDEEIPQPADQKVRDKIEAARIAYITDQLELTPSEAEKFWPIYREFAERRREIRQQMRDAKSANPQQTDQEAVDQQFKMKQQELDLEKDYSGRLLKVISAQKLRSLPQAERKFRQMILDQIQRRQMQQERLRDRNQQQLQKRNN